MSPIMPERFNSTSAPIFTGNCGQPPDWKARALAAEQALTEARARVADYENRITWDTTCAQCAAYLDSSVKDYERAEQARAELAALRAKLTTAAADPLVWEILRAALASPVEPQPTEGET